MCQLVVHLNPDVVNSIKMEKSIFNYIKSLEIESILEERKDVLEPFIHYLNLKKERKEAILLNFICTHNSRRSQFAQVWAQVISHYFSIETSCFSGGIEVTAFNERAIDALKRIGFNITHEGSQNPMYTIRYSDEAEPIIGFSKLYDDSSNPKNGFAALMTCSDADENCPFIPGTEKRIPLNYEDPKVFDDTELEIKKYDERCKQIASEMYFVFSQIK